MPAKNVKATINVFWNDKHQAWEGAVNLRVGHVCTCGHCARTGLTLQGVVSSGINQDEAFQLACQNIQMFLSAVQGVPMSILSQPGTPEVEFAEDVLIPAYREYYGEGGEDEEEGYHEIPKRRR